MSSCVISLVSRWTPMSWMLSVLLTRIPLFLCVHDTSVSSIISGTSALCWRHRITRPRGRWGGSLLSISQCSVRLIQLPQSTRLGHISIIWIRRVCHSDRQLWYMQSISWVRGGRHPQRRIRGHSSPWLCIRDTSSGTTITVGVYIVMVCQWTDHILARNPLLEVEADLSWDLERYDFPTRFSLINLESDE